MASCGTWTWCLAAFIQHGLLEVHPAALRSFSWPGVSCHTDGPGVSCRTDGPPLVAMHLWMDMGSLPAFSYYEESSEELWYNVLCGHVVLLLVGECVAVEGLGRRVTPFTPPTCSVSSPTLMVVGLFILTHSTVRGGVQWGSC